MANWKGLHGVENERSAGQSLAASAWAGLLGLPSPGFMSEAAVEDGWARFHASKATPGALCRVTGGAQQEEDGIISTTHYRAKIMLFLMRRPRVR